VALALADDARIIACDISDEWTGIARRYWAEAGVAGKIELRLGPAVATLDQLLAQGHAGTIDFAFIDADKGNYWKYYERSLMLLRKGGLVAVDNVLWGGRVIDPSNDESDTQAIRQFNQRMAGDTRVDISMLPIGDGLTLAVKK
jgi:caffeoyl-CoA O-methyltransferase